MSPAAALKKGASKITNRPDRLTGLDNRSSAGRRRRDLIRGYITALGGPEKVSPAMMNDITRAADLIVIAEQKRAEALRGVAVDMGDLIRLEGAADRAVRRLAIKPGAQPAGPTLQEYLATKYGARTADNAEAP
jgi:hypothetical protein